MTLVVIYHQQQADQSKSVNVGKWQMGVLLKLTTKLSVKHNKEQKEGTYMESVRIIELQNDSSILAIYNPDDIASYGLTSSFLSEYINAGMNGPILMQFIADFVHEHLMDDISDDYNDYMPVALSIMNLPNDRILPAMLLIKRQSAFLAQYVQLRQRGPQPIDEEAKQYITEYINEFMQEKNSNGNKKQSKDEKQEPIEYIDQYLFRFENLNNAMSACKFIPFEKCIESSLIKYDKTYYILFLCDSKESDHIYGNVLQFLEYGDEEEHIAPEFLQEHGTLITDQLEKIVQAGIV